jgi:NitT/TauT family transport system ATP-binding protein
VQDKLAKRLTEAPAAAKGSLHVSLSLHGDSSNMSLTAGIPAATSASAIAEVAEQARTSAPPFAVVLQDAAVGFPGGQAAVWQHLNLQLAPGEFLTLLGPSGCGKSTVLRVMAGLQPLTQGRINRPATAPAFVFQEPALLPWASLQDNVALPLRISGQASDAAATRVQAVLSRVGLQGAEHRLPHELSGGMRMRASIARALVMQPDLLLLDEPFAALDDPTRQRLQADLLQWWQAEGFALCFVTHQVAEAVFMSTRVAVMSAHPGRIAREFTITEPYPRTDAFRESARFHELCVAVGQALRGEGGP